MRKDQNEYVTVMICVAVHGRPVIGVVHQPFLSPPPRISSSTTPSSGGLESSSINDAAVASAEGETTAPTGRTYWAWVGRGSNFEVPAATEVPGTSSKTSSSSSSTGSRGRTADGPPKMTFATEQPLPRVIISQSHPGVASSVLNSSFHNLTLIKAGGAGYKTLAVIGKKADLYYHQTRIKVGNTDTSLFYSQYSLRQSHYHHQQQLSLFLSLSLSLSLSFSLSFFLSFLLLHTLRSGTYALATL